MTTMIVKRQPRITWVRAERAWPGPRALGRQESPIVVCSACGAVTEGEERHAFEPPRLRKGVVVRGKVVDGNGRATAGREPKGRGMVIKFRMGWTAACGLARDDLWFRALSRKRRRNHFPPSPIAYSVFHPRM